MSSDEPATRKPNAYFLGMVVLAVIAAIGLGWQWWTRPWRPSSISALEPKLALAALRGPKTFFFGGARTWLAKEKPQLIPEAARDAGSTFSRGLNQAVQDPKLFREIDRQSRFDEVWLLGDPSSYKPLVEHFLETKDFTLSYVDHTSLVFRRGGEPWSQAQIDSLGAQFSDPRERAYVQALAAAKLAIVRQPEPALKLLEEAENASARVPEVWTGWSTYRMVKGQWDKALEAAEKALQLDGEFLPGIACRAQCYYGTKQFTAAWKDAERLVAAHPDDPAMLFYHAKLAHEANAFQSEIGSLTRLIALAEQAGANVSGYRIYLAQAYAATNDADNAMDQVTLALLDTTLPREQRKFADELLAQIQRATSQTEAR
jgi:tetratricopeptide (TPR) repeat protein